MMYKAQIHVMLKQDVADVQGSAIEQSLRNHGHTVGNIRVGKYFEVEIEAENEADARNQLDKLSQGTFSNPVIENYRLTLGKKAEG